MRSLFAMAAVALSATCAAQTGAMPFELAFHHRTLSDPQRTAVSADGKYVAYGVLDSDRVELFVTETATGRSRVISPRESSCSGASFSPDGARLAFHCESAGAARPWIHELASESTRQVGAASLALRLQQGESLQWTPSGTELLVSLELPDALAAVDVNTGGVRVIVPAATSSAPRGLRLSPSGKWLAYASSYRPVGRSLPESIGYVNDLAVVPAAGGAAIAVAGAVPAPQELPGFTFPESYYLSGEQSYLWHPTRDQLFWARDGRLWTYDLSGDETQPRTLAAKLTTVAAPLAFSRDGKTLLVSTQAGDGSGYGTLGSSVLAAVPLGDGEPKMLPPPAGQVFSQLITQRRALLWQPTAGVATAVTREIDTGETAIVSLDLVSGTYRKLWKGRALLGFAGAAADHGALVGRYEDMNTPGDLFRFSSSSFSRTRISAAEPRFSGVQTARAETFRTSVPQYDGGRTSVTSVILLPKGAKRDDRLPTLVLLYPRAILIDAAARFGGGAPSMLPASLFTTRGYAVLLAATPIFPHGMPGNLADELIDVLLPQVQTAAALGYTDIERVAVGGISFGGYSTAMILSATQTFRAGIALAGVYDITYFATAHETVGADGPDPVNMLEYGYGMRGHPWQDMNRYVSNSPFFRADRIQAPLLMLHQTDDPICPVHDARKMYRALKLLGRTAEYVESAGSGHGLGAWPRPAVIDAGQRVVAFLDEHVK